MIYLDHNATTPVLPEVREAMLPYLGEEWGNPSSTYRFGSKLKSKIEEARERVAALIGAKTPREILFTSGGTESNNTAIHAALLSRPGKRHIVTSQVECHRRYETWRSRPPEHPLLHRSHKFSG